MRREPKNQSEIYIYIYVHDNRKTNTNYCEIVEIRRGEGGG